MGLSLEACRRADNGAQGAHEKILELQGAAEAQSFFQEGCPGNQLTLSPRQQAQARLSTGSGGLGLPSTEARRMSASIESRVGTLPEVIADLTGSLGARAPLIEHRCPTWRQLEGVARHMKGNEESYGGNHPRILVGMEPWCGRGPGLNAPRGRHAGRA